MQRLISLSGFFCHPYGDVSEVTQEMVRKSGYAGAFGSLEFSSKNTKENLYNMKRMGIRYFSNRDDFKAGISGAYDWYLRVKSCFGA